MKREFTHLHLHTAYSISTGTISIPELVEYAKTKQIKSLAITDHLNLFGVIKFYEKCISNRIKPIIGCEIPIKGFSKNQKANVILLCQNFSGYRNLLKLVSEAHINKKESDLAEISIDQIIKYNQDLILLAGGRNGLIGRNILLEQSENFESTLRKLSNIFQSRMYIQIERTRRTHEKEYNNRAILLAEKFQLPIVASNDVQFLSKDEFESHEIRVCINKKIKLEDRINQSDFNESQYFKEQSEMEELYSDLPDALDNVSEIIKRCNFHLDTSTHQLPKFSLPSDISTEEYFNNVIHEGLENILNDNPKLDAKIYHKRLKDEVNIISEMGFISYFLIVQEFILWARENSIPVGPGRGSGAGSLVAYALGITSIDPIKHNLLFERFLNPERISLPDFDIDFCVNSRQRIIEHITDIYGEEKVSQIITYNSMTARAVIRDVGRVLGMSYGFVDRIAKQIPFTPGITIDEALSQNKEFEKECKANGDIRNLINLSKQLEGLPRNIGKHAAGIVIAPSDITNHMPIYRVEESNELVTQFDKDDIEKLGLIKFDILGLRTLTIIDRSLKTIKEKNKNIEFEKIDRNDEKVFTLLQKKLTTGVFQLESFGMKRYMGRLKPDSFNDIVALVALYRPGPLGTNMVDDFISNKHGSEIHYEHPLLKDILSDTYGLILYQEQVMEISRTLANYSLGEADLLRRAMGKKKKKEMELHRKKFIDGAAEKNISGHVANSIFSKMEKFAGYGFNKSHSVAYADIAYQTAYLKSYYPSEFLAAALSSDMDRTDKIITLNDACREMNINIKMPNINQSGVYFSSIDRHNILFGLGAIKGVGNAASKHIIEEREKNGSFNNIFNFCERVSLNTINIGTMEALAYSGAFDSFGQPRDEIIDLLHQAISYGQHKQATILSGQQELFSNDSKGVMEQGKHFKDRETNDRKINSIERRLKILSEEKNIIGFYLSGHPIKEFENELNEMSIMNIKTYYERFYSNGQTNQVIENSTICGVIVNVRQQRIGQDKYMYIITVDDSSGRIQVILYSEAYFQYRDLLIENKILFFSGKMSIDEFDSQLVLRVNKISSFDDTRKKYSKSIEITLQPNYSDKKILNDIADILEPYRNGDCNLTIKCITEGHSIPLSLNKKWKIIPSVSLINNLKDLLGKENIKVKYH